jgi:hypothetical protein
MSNRGLKLALVTFRVTGGAFCHSSKTLVFIALIAVASCAQAVAWRHWER